MMPTGKQAYTGYCWVWQHQPPQLWQQELPGGRGKNRQRPSWGETAACAPGQQQSTSWQQQHCPCRGAMCRTCPSCVPTTEGKSSNGRAATEGCGPCAAAAPTARAPSPLDPLSRPDQEPPVPGNAPVPPAEDVVAPSRALLPDSCDPGSTRARRLDWPVAAAAQAQRPLYQSCWLAGQAGCWAGAASVASPIMGRCWPPAGWSLARLLAACLERRAAQQPEQPACTPPATSDSCSCWCTLPSARTSVSFSSLTLWISYCAACSCWRARSSPCRHRVVVDGGVGGAWGSCVAGWSQLGRSARPASCTSLQGLHRPACCTHTWQPQTSTGSDLKCAVQLQARVHSRQLCQHR
jgi:hypothetical protein